MSLPARWRSSNGHGSVTLLGKLVRALDFHGHVGSANQVHLNERFEPGSVAYEEKLFSSGRGISSTIALVGCGSALAGLADALRELARMLRSA